MKVLIQITKPGKYKDQAWEPTKMKSKGEVFAVTPSYAAQLIEKEQAVLVDNGSENILIDA
ncbi:hypothetical protein [Vibrio gallicus]|uniref:hypothetical protein n=1 Tax=Vibrio gallicus TaxID=190897 RepID=UPI0021C27B7B|nr:hypothetical protein [Vibrio gallicus]